MAAGDDAVEKAADTLQKTADKAAARGGLAERAAQPLADDAAFVRKLKPSLVAKRIKGELPTGQSPAKGALKAPKRNGGGGPNPVVILGAALALGVFLAKVLDWRSHAHPRD
jgi:hypothetical protein